MVIVHRYVTGWWFEPLWKIWVRQYWDDDSQYMEKEKSCSSHHQPGKRLPEMIDRFSPKGLVQLLPAWIVQLVLCASDGVAWAPGPLGLVPWTCTMRWLRHEFGSNPNNYGERKKSADTQTHRLLVILCKTKSHNIYTVSILYIMMFGVAIYGCNVCLEYEPPSIIYCWFHIYPRQKSSNSPYDIHIPKTCLNLHPDSVTKVATLR